MFAHLFPNGDRLRRCNGLGWVVGIGLAVAVACAFVGWNNYMMGIQDSNHSEMVKYVNESKFHIRPKKNTHAPFNLFLKKLRANESNKEKKKRKETFLLATQETITVDDKLKKTRKHLYATFRKIYKNMNTSEDQSLIDRWRTSTSTERPAKRRKIYLETLYSSRNRSDEF